MGDQGEEEDLEGEGEDSKERGSVITASKRGTLQLTAPNRQNAMCARTGGIGTMTAQRRREQRNKGIHQRGRDPPTTLSMERVTMWSLHRKRTEVR